MNYQLGKDFIKIYSKDEFNPSHILECGQVFCYRKEGDKFIVFPGKEYAEIEENDECYVIKTLNPAFFEHWFDLDTDYSLIKKELVEFEIMKKPLNFGYGIRILNQDPFETLISFILSANNNIKRIMMILNNLREKLGEKIYDNVYSFPPFEKLRGCNEEFFKQMGAGYRAKYLVNVLKQINPSMLEEFRGLDTKSLRNKLIDLSGVGPKVADCVLLFGYAKGDVFPVDTWIEKMYNSYFPKLENREKIRKNLVDMFGFLSGQAQQYLFYYQRSGQ